MIPEDFRVEELEGDDFEGNKLEYATPPYKFKDEELAGDDFDGTQAEVKG